MKHQLSTTFAGILLLGGLVQARYVVVMDAGSSRTTASLYSESADSGFGVTLVAKEESAGGGISGVHDVIKENESQNVAYFTALLEPLATKLKENKVQADEIVDVYTFGTGGLRLLSEEEQKLLWERISEAIGESTTKDSMKGVHFRLADTQTLAGEDEGRLMMVAAHQKHNAQMAIDIGGESSEVVFGTEVRAFEKLGAVRASKTVWEKLLPREYNEAVGRMIGNPEGRKTLEEWTKTENPCLMKANDWGNVVAAFNQTKPVEDTYRAVVPFIGTGDYETCLKSIKDHAFNGTEFDIAKDIPKDLTLVGVRHLYFNERNLQRVGIFKEEPKKARTVGDFVDAAKTVCAKKFDELQTYTQGDRRKTISPHGLVELCWSTTYSAAMLTSFLGLDHTNQIIIDNIGWSMGKAIELLLPKY